MTAWNMPGLFLLLSARTLIFKWEANAYIGSISTKHPHDGHPVNYINTEGKWNGWGWRYVPLTPSPLGLMADIHLDLKSRVFGFLRDIRESKAR